MLVIAIAPATYFNRDTAGGQIGATDISSSVACLYDPAIGPAVWEQRGLAAWQDCIDTVKDRVHELREKFPDVEEMIANGTAFDHKIPYATQLMVEDPPGTCKAVEPLPFTASGSFQAMLYSIALLGWAFLSRFLGLWMPLTRFITLRIGRPVVVLIERLI